MTGVSPGLRRAFQTAERRTQRTGELWVVVKGETRTGAQTVSPYRVLPLRAVQPEDTILHRPVDTTAKPAPEITLALFNDDEDA